MTDNPRWIVERTPVGALTADDFRFEIGHTVPCEDGDVRCKVLMLSIDAANRAWLQGRTYRAQILPGRTMAGFGLGEVVESNSPDLKVGDIVSGDLGWQEYATVPARWLERLSPRGQLSHELSLYGITGITAYVGLLKIGEAKAGQTVVVSAAAGATGSLVGQIARIIGARVVGVCGSEAKGQWLIDKLGYDAAVSHRDPEFGAALKTACPDGIDVYFDNVGGPVLEHVLRRMNLYGRVVCCGVVSQYDTTDPAPGPAGVPGLLVTKRIRMEGFIGPDHHEQNAEAFDALESWVANGDLVVTEDTAEGIEALPEALMRLLNGKNIGKQLVHLADSSGT